MSSPLASYPRLTATGFCESSCHALQAAGKGGADVEGNSSYVHSSGRLGGAKSAGIKRPKQGKGLVTGNPGS